MTRIVCASACERNSWGLCLRRHHVHLRALPPPIHLGAPPCYGANMRARSQYVSGGHALHATQGCRASLHGAHSHFGADGTRSHIILELQREVGGGWRWLSGVRRCVGCQAQGHLTTWLWLRLHQFAPLPERSPQTSVASLLQLQRICHPSCCEPQE